MPWPALHSARHTDSCWRVGPSVLFVCSEGLIPKIRAQDTAESSSDSTTAALGAIQQHHQHSQRQPSPTCNEQSHQELNHCVLVVAILDQDLSGGVELSSALPEHGFEDVFRGLSITLYCNLILRVVDDQFSARFPTIILHRFEASCAAKSGLPVPSRDLLGV